MSIKLLAIELYRAQQVVDCLIQRQKEAAENPGATLPATFHEEFRHALLELQRLRQMLEEKKKSAVDITTSRHRRHLF